MPSQKNMSQIGVLGKTWVKSIGLVRIQMKASLVWVLGPEKENNDMWHAIQVWSL